MTEGIKKWNDQLQSIQLEVNETMAKLNPNKQEKFKEIIREKSETAKKDWEKAFTTLRKTYQEEMDSEASQFLLKLSDDESDSESQPRTKTKNSRGRGIPHSRGGRGRGHRNIDKWKPNHHLIVND